MLENTTSSTEVLKSRSTLTQNRAKYGRADQIQSYVDLLIHHDEKELASHLIRKVLNQNPYDIDMVDKLVKCLNPDHKLEEIIKLAEFRVSQRMNFSTLSELAGLYYRKGNFEMALSTYMSVLQYLNQDTLPRFFDVYKNLGNIFTLKGEYDGASEYYCKANEIKPNSDVLMVNFATLEMQKKNYDEALQRFREAVRINSRNDRAWVGLGLVHDLMGDKDLALANIKKALDCSPINRTALQLFASWANNGQLVDQVVECLQVYLSEVDFDEEVSSWLIEMYLKKKQMSLAQLELERVLLWNPRSDLGQVYIAKLAL